MGRRGARCVGAGDLQGTRDGGRPKDPVYVVDVAALPEAPPGSDADRIARGLAPRGSRFDDGETPVATMESEEETPDPAVDDTSQTSAEPGEVPEG